MAGVAYSTISIGRNIDRNAERNQNRNKKSIVEIDFKELTTYLKESKALAKAEKEKHLLPPIEEENGIEESRSQRISNFVGGENTVSDQIYQRRSEDDLFKSGRFAEGKSNRKRFKNL